MRGSLQGITISTTRRLRGQTRSAQGRRCPDPYFSHQWKRAIYRNALLANRSAVQSRFIVPDSTAGLEKWTLSRLSSVRRCSGMHEWSPRIQKKLEAFRDRIADPDHMWVSGGDARRKYSLTTNDLQELRRNAIHKESPYDGKVVTQYFLPDVIELARLRYGEDRMEDNYLKYVREGEERRIRGRIYDGSKKQIGILVPPTLSKSYWYSGPSTATVEGRESVRQGLISNSLICFIKSGVWLYTGSHAVFADLMHSTADVANYGYRLLQLSRSTQNADIMHPYGYAPLRYITADRSFVILGGLGGFFPCFMGISELFHLMQGGAASAMTADLIVPSACIFVASMALEGVAMNTAYREILAQAAATMPDNQSGDTSGWRRCYDYILEGPDVMSVATFCEAGSGVFGAAVGLCGLGLSWYFESIVFDVGASLFMSSIVGVVSMFLLSRSGAALLGRTLPTARVAQIVQRIEDRATVVTVHDVKTEVLGVDTVRFKAEVQFNPEVVTERMLGVRVSEAWTLSNVGAVPRGDRCATVPERVHERLQASLPQLDRGFANDEEARNDWLYANNAIFYEALAWELQRVEAHIKNDLKDFRNVHIDLEPW